MQWPVNRLWVVVFLQASSAMASSATSERTGNENQKAEPMAETTPRSATSDDDGRARWSADFGLLEEYRLRIVSHALADRGPLGQPVSPNQASDQRLRLLGDGQITGMDDRFHAVMSGALWLDLDGAGKPGTGSLFATQYDNAQPWWAVYALSAQWQGKKALDYVRVGRQASEHGMPLTFDGAALSLRVIGRELELFGFGGKTVHFFESMPGLFENWVASTGAVLRPTGNSKIEVDTRLIREPTANADRSELDPITNHSYGVAATLGSDSLQSKVYARGIDRHPSHVGGAFMFQSERLSLGLDARIHGQLQTLGEVVESENPYYSILGRSLPYVRFRFELWKDFELGRLTRFDVHVGWRGRQVVGYPEQRFNRNAGALYLNAQLEDFVRKGLFLGGSVEHAYVPYVVHGERMLTLGGFAGYRNLRLKAELGSYFQQYKLVYYQTAEELHNTRTVYGSLGFRVTDWLELLGKYEIDIFDRYLQSFFFSARQELQ